MKLLPLTLVFALICMSVACTKEDEDKPEGPSEYEIKAKEFEAFISNKYFKLTEFYADKPIDYIQDDSVVKAETNLWPYVRDYIKDDRNYFNSAAGTLEIEQNEIKIPTNDSAILKRNYGVGFNRNTAYIDFVDYNYVSTRYRLYEFKENYFIIHLEFRNRTTNETATIFSKFEQMQ